MNRIAIMTAAWLATCVLIGAAQPTTTAEVQLKAAMNAEQVDGDLAGAIRQYKAIITVHARNRDIVAKALLQLAGCYEKQGDRQARQSYERIVREFSDVGAVARAAKARLAALRTESASPFVARTLAVDLEHGSPDGRVAIYHKGDGFGRVALRDLASTTERVLIDLDGAVSNFAFSPDSRQLAFDYQNTAMKIRETRIVTIATGQMRTLPVRHGYPIAWTAAGDIVFYRPNYSANRVDFTLASSETGERRSEFAQPVSEGCCPLVTPDGSRMVAPRGKRLVVVDLKTRAEISLTEGSAEEIRPVLSPDGRLAAFVSNRDGKWGLYVAPLDRAPVPSPVLVALIDEHTIGARRGNRYDWWTAGGTLTIAQSSTEANIFRIGVDAATGRTTGSPQRLTQDAPRNFGAAVSPDGTQIAYQYREASRGGVALMDARGIGERGLIDFNGNLPVGWRSADEIVFYDFATEAGRRPAITAFNIKTGTRTPIASVEGLYWQYVPARGEIVHSHRGGGGAKPGAQLKAWSVAEGKDRDIATVDYLVPWWSVSPDGRRIAFSTARNVDAPSVECELALMSIDGRREKTLLQNSPLCGVGSAWSPDGRFLLVNTASKGPHVMNVDTGDIWPVHASTSDQNWRGDSWSPDGTFIALSNNMTRNERLAWDGVTYEAVTRLMARQARR